MLRFFRYLGPYWLKVILLIAAIGGQVWGTLELPALMAKIVNEGIATGNDSVIWGIGLQMLGCTAIAASCALVASFYSSRVGAAVARDIRDDVYQKILSFSIAEIDKFSTASLITRTTNDIAQVQQTIILCLSMLLRVPMMAAGAIYEAIKTAPDMTWIILLAVGALLVSAVAIVGLALPKFKIFQELLDKITLLTRENLTGLRVIRAFNKQSYERKKFEKENNAITRANIFINNVMSFQVPIMTLIFNGTTLLCIWVGISLLTTNMSYLGDMMAFMQYAIQVVLSFLFLVVLFVLLPRANVSAKRINEVLKTKPKVIWKEKTKGTPEKSPSVEFKNVSFAYDNAETNALEKVSFKAEAGKTTAFIGSTGSGKSTLVNLIPRFYDTTKGEVLINGINVKNYAKKDLMKRIGLVPQKGVLFAGSIKSNIAFGNSKADVKSAAEIAQAKEFIEKLPKNYDNHIAQGGTNVSGGQKQRLSIARVIAKKPEIYVFDDSFSALDMKTDAKLRKALEPATKSSVVLIVAQRVSTIKNADQIIVLDQGKVRGVGSHKELLKSSEIYREIVKSQFSDEEYKKELKDAR
ncbi:ABC transporter ATP-binding protein [Candidatus Saccharibacteria bacterium]|nr:ABC transporter ATP-binding protein [Candidatus Saccharibacteria bacterium]